MLFIVDRLLQLTIRCFCYCDVLKPLLPHFWAYLHSAFEPPNNAARKLQGTLDPEGFGPGSPDDGLAPERRGRCQLQDPAQWPRPGRRLVAYS